MRQECGNVDAPDHERYSRISPDTLLPQPRTTLYPTLPSPSVSSVFPPCSVFSVRSVVETKSPGLVPGALGFIHTLPAAAQNFQPMVAK